MCTVCNLTMRYQSLSTGNLLLDASHRSGVITKTVQLNSSQRIIKASASSLPPGNPVPMP